MIDEFYPGYRANMFAGWTTAAVMSAAMTLAPSVLVTRVDNAFRAPEAVKEKRIVLKLHLVDPAPVEEAEPLPTPEEAAASPPAPAPPVTPEPFAAPARTPASRSFEEAPPELTPPVPSSRAASEEPRLSRDAAASTEEREKEEAERAAKEIERRRRLAAVAARSSPSLPDYFDPSTPGRKPASRSADMAAGIPDDLSGPTSPPQAAPIPSVKTIARDQDAGYAPASFSPPLAAGNPSDDGSTDGSREVIADLNRQARGLTGLGEFFPEERRGEWIELKVVAGVDGRIAPPVKWLTAAPDEARREIEKAILRWKLKNAPERPLEHNLRFKIERAE